MKTKTIQLLVASLGVLLVLGAGTALLAETVPAGTALHVRLQQTISSKDAKSGQEFGAVLDQPLVVNGKTLAPKGATVHGIVATAVPSGRLSRPAQLYLKLKSIDINGKSYALVTNVRGGRGQSHKKRDAVAIGGGAGLGAAIGAIAGGGKGAAIGAAAGAGAGTAGAAITGKKDIEYPVETQLTFTLRQAIAVP